MNDNKKWEFFSPQLLKDIRERFCCVESDPYNGRRIYFENAGGSLRLKSVVELLNLYTSLPDSPNRPSLSAKPLKELIINGKEDVKKFLGADDGQIVSSETASRVIFLIVGAIIENIPGTNVVTTLLEHPSNHDACSFYAKKTGKEFRAANVNSTNGGVDLDEILSKIDKSTCLLSFIAASNITGKVLDIENIIREARKINPDLYIFLDATQHVAHAPMFVKKWGIDGIGFTPYKIFGKRGIGLGWVSKRVASLPHEKVLEKPIDEWGSGSVEPVAFGAWSAIIDYVCWLGKHFNDASDRRALILSGMKSIELHERALLERALNGTDKIKGLRKINGVKVHFLPENEDLATRDCLIPLTIDGKRTNDIVRYYLENGIIVYDRVRTNPMSRRTLDSVKLKEVIRVTPLHCNNKEEIDKFLRLTQNIV
jgi:selenocysteine lyase/cysteine desulfurase